MSVCRSMWSNASVSVRRASAFLIPMTYHRTTGAIQNVAAKVASAQDVQPENESKPILPQRTPNILVPNISTEIIMEPTTCGTHHTHVITYSILQTAYKPESMCTLTAYPLVDDVLVEDQNSV